MRRIGARSGGGFAGRTLVPRTPSSCRVSLGAPASEAPSEPSNPPLRARSFPLHSEKPGADFGFLLLACAAALFASGALCVSSCVSLARAGGSLLASVGTLQLDTDTFTRRASRLAPFQWARFGATWPERRRRFLDEVLIPEALLELEAGRRQRSAGARDTALSEALIAELRADVLRTPVSEEDVARYHASHQRYYETPRRLLLWRILVRTEAEARALLGQLGAQPKEAEWSQLARERSLDVATHMRSGSLGDVSASGQSHFPQVRVAPALFAAADRVPDGALVPEPVAENDGFAVVWRRASREAQARPLSDLTPEIRARILEQRHAAAYTELLERLRREQLGQHQPELLAGFAPEPTEPSPRRHERLSPAPLPTRPVRLLPQPTDRGLR